MVCSIRARASTHTSAQVLDVNKVSVPGGTWNSLGPEGPQRLFLAQEANPYVMFRAHGPATLKPFQLVAVSHLFSFPQTITLGFQKGNPP